MTGKNQAPPTAAQRRLAAQRAAAARQRIEATQRRRRLLTVLASVGTVIVLVAVLVVVKVATSGPSTPQKTGQASRSVTSLVTSVPPSVLDKVAAGSGALGPRSTLTGAALTANGLPRVLFVGAEWCPYCAGERWALAVALSRFGTLTHLGVTRSRSDDVDPDTATLSFHGSHYSSKYIALTAAEIQDNAGKTLDHISAADNTLFQTIGNGFPFIDVGGKFYFSIQYDPGLLGGSSMSQEQIARAIHDPSSKIAKAVDGSANILTAAICTRTGSSPASVCTAPGVVAAAKTLTATS